MYIHFFCRPITFKEKEFTIKSKYLIYPEELIDYNNEFELTYNFIKKKSKKRKIRFFLKAIYFNRKKITLKKIMFNIKGMIARQFKFDR